ncbi:hypothetical protein ACJZ2D_010451 [Fusarium nematophilum]
MSIEEATAEVEKDVAAARNDTLEYTAASGKDGAVVEKDGRQQGALTIYKNCSVHHKGQSFIPKTQALESMSTPPTSEARIANDMGNHLSASQDITHTAGQDSTPSLGAAAPASTDDESSGSSIQPLESDDMSSHNASEAMCLDSPETVNTAPGNKRASKTRSKVGSSAGEVGVLASAKLARHALPQSQTQPEPSPPSSTVSSQLPNPKAQPSDKPSLAAQVAPQRRWTNNPFMCENLPSQAQNTFRVLYHIVCPDNFHCSRSRIFTRAPEFAVADTGDGIAHLDGAPYCAVESLEWFARIEQDLSFIIFRCYDCRSCPLSTDPLHIPYTEHILVTSPTLQNSLTRVMTFDSDSDAYMAQLKQLYPGQDELKQPSNTYSMRFFYHFKSLFPQALDEAVTFREKDDISALRDYSNSYFRTLSRQHPDIMDRGLFLSKDIGELQAYVLRSWPTEGQTMTLDCWHWESVGWCLRRKPIELNLARPCEDVFTIRDLEVFPSSSATQTELDRLRKRGSQFYNLHPHRLVEFLQHNAKDVQDHDTYHQLHPTSGETASAPKQMKLFDMWPLKLPVRMQIESRHFMVMPSRIQAFSMENKTWASLSAEDIRALPWNCKAFERLVLPASTKDMITSLVMLHASAEGRLARRRSASRKQDDFFRQTKGVTLLLEGEPGTGKTLTAAERPEIRPWLLDTNANSDSYDTESVADVAHAPLFTLTARESCGMTPQEKGTLWKTAILLSKKWGCVLLLDGADDLLGEDAAEPEMKRVVSDFVRELNAFDGILILATNTASSVEAKFTSRMTVTIRFAPHDQASRKCLWQNFADLASKDGEKMDVSGIEEGIDELAKHEMNGRQIRDVFAAARHLACYKREALGFAHLEQVIGARSHGV